jgi:L-ascorbate metabolism protein UlaG (beta-lactamase superfamily)
MSRRRISQEVTALATLGRDTKITWFGHATFLYETPGGKRIMVDPWVYENPACPEKMKTVGSLDAMLITHGHFDHIVDAVQLAQATRPNQIVCIFEIDNWLGRKGVENTIGMNKGGTVDVQGV